ncbi:hypothetical protein QQG91_02110 [Marivivens sp. LCG002]|uniref:hypothetical protein n=1 Tax=Marivivens sp. LCG002 TaxID=3051171 RepID=UPI0025539394|nr:hypothetical protein [Marivivens sp. LCG002]WIV51259.1 hypothetical protein QQG91_02110 [Marivivens sp. LCG002]
MSIELRLPRHKTLSEQVEMLLDQVLDQDRDEALDILQALYTNSKQGKERRALRAFILALLTLGPVEVVEPEELEPPEPEPEPEPAPEPEPEPAPPPKPKKKKEMSMMTLDLSDAAMLLQFGGGADTSDEEPAEEPVIEASIADFDTDALVDDMAQLLDVEGTSEREEFVALADPIELDPAEAVFIDEKTPFPELTSDDMVSEEGSESDAQPVDVGEIAPAPKPKKQKKAATSLEDSSALFAALGPGFSDE